MEQEHHSCGKFFESLNMYLFREDLNWYREPVGVSMTTSMLGVAEAEFSSVDLFLVFILQAFRYGCRWRTA